MVCPIGSADELARAWPEATYVIVPDSGPVIEVGSPGGGVPALVEEVPA